MLLLSLRLLLVGLSLSISVGWFLLFLFLHATAATIFRHPGKLAIWRARDPTISQLSGSASPVATARATTAVAIPAAPTIAVKGTRWSAVPDWAFETFWGSYAPISALRIGRSPLNAAAQAGKGGGAQ